MDNFSFNFSIQAIRKIIFEEQIGKKPKYLHENLMLRIGLI